MFENVSSEAAVEIVESYVKREEFHQAGMKSGAVRIAGSPEEVASLKGKLWTKSLPPELLPVMEQLYRTVGRYVSPTLEEWERGFMYDMHPGSEVFIWGLIEAAWKRYHKQYLNGKLQPTHVEKRLLGLLCGIANGVKAKNLTRVEEKIWDRLKKCHDDTMKNDASAFFQRVADYCSE